MHCKALVAPVVLALLLLLCPTLSHAVDRYISFSAGNDGNNGLSSGAPWKTFNAVNGLTLAPGDRVFLKAGDTWNQELNLTGVGNAANPITLTTYGGSGMANIHRSDVNLHRCVVIRNGQYWRISNLDCRTAKLGIYLRYQDTWYNNDMQITYCYFKDIANGLVNPRDFDYNLEYGPSAGIWLGGKVLPSNSTPVLDNLLVQYCTFENVDHGVGMNYYWLYDPPYRSCFRQVRIWDCVAIGCLQGLAHLNLVDGGSLRRTRSLNGGGYSPNGITAGFAQYCKNFTIDDNEFAYTKRINCPDGVGWDFEGACENMVFSNNVLHNNDGPAVLTMSSFGHNINTSFINNTTYNNAKNPYNDPNHDNNVEMVCHHSGNTGTMTNNGFYRGPAANALSGNWQNFSQSNNRNLTMASLGTRYALWEFNTTNDLQGWSNFQQWTSNTVSSGTLWGLSTGVDPFASALTFVNVFDGRYVKVRMKQTQGNWAQVFFITDTDTAWNSAKSITFPIIPDNTMREYTVDLNTIDSKGVITQLRLDPTVASNSHMGIDYVRFAN